GGSSPRAKSSSNSSFPRTAISPASSAAPASHAVARTNRHNSSTQSSRHMEFTKDKRSPEGRSASSITSSSRRNQSPNRDRNGCKLQRPHGHRSPQANHGRWIIDIACLSGLRAVEPGWLWVGEAEPRLFVG